MNNPVRQLIDGLLDQYLEVHLKNIGKTEASLLFLGEYIEIFYKKGHFFHGQYLQYGAEVLVPEILKGSDNKVLPVEAHATLIADACNFATEYYSLRDSIYYSFADNKSISWSQEGNKITIEVNDPSIFRQIACERQSFATNSTNEIKMSKGIASDELLALLKNTKYQDLSDGNVIKANSDIERQVKMKLKYFSDSIPVESTATVENYTYKELIEVYQSILFMALYERNYSEANDLSSVVTYQEDEFIENLSGEYSIERARCKTILQDLATASRGTFNYFERDKKFFLFPFCFSLIDGISAVLKQYARRDSDAFSANCAGIIGNTLVEKVSSYFASYKNFRILRDVKLAKFDAKLPDIDVLAVSYEPSLGFHFFVCEIKNSLVSTWAKDHLKVTGKKGFITKALSQIKLISDFLKTEPGQRLLYDIAKDLFSHLPLKKLFPTGFMAVVDNLIVTSQHIGMFFPDAETTIINDDFFREIMKKSDGDVNFILHHLRHFNENIDACYERFKETVQIGEYEITYDACKMTGILQIEEHEYLSIGELEKLEEMSLTEGYRFIDTILPGEKETTEKGSDGGNASE